MERGGTSELSSQFPLLMLEWMCKCFIQARRSCCVGDAAAGAEAKKRRRYASQAQEAGYRFKPFGMELFGAWGTAAIELLSELTEQSRSLGANDTRLVGNVGVRWV